MEESSEKPVNSSTGNDGNVKLQWVTFHPSPPPPPPHMGKSSIIEKPFELKTLYVFEMVIIKDKVNNSTNTTTSADNADKRIPKESAVCRFCFRKFIVDDDNQNVLKTRCLCDMTLTHEKCAEDWFGVKGNLKCERCSQDIKFIPIVILSPAGKTEYSSAPAQPTTKERKLLTGSSKATTQRGILKDKKKRDSGSRRGWFGNLV